VVFWALSSSFCYSEESAVTGTGTEVYSTTNNAAANGLSWVMANILPAQTGLTIGNVFYRYTVDKEAADNLLVHVQNENAQGPGYVFRSTDDWSGLPGNTISRLISIENTPATAFGTGSIETEGAGTISDPTVIYSYKYDECYVVISNPECPGYEDALFTWMQDQGLFEAPPQPGDPYYDEYVQLVVNRDQMDDEEEDLSDREQREEREEDASAEDPIRELNAGMDIEGFVTTAKEQERMLRLSAVPQFNTYYQAQIPGGAYPETVKLPDSDIPDNRRALRNLASDQVHSDMVRSQYKN